MRGEVATVRALIARLRRARRYPFPQSGRALVCPRSQGAYLIFDPAGRVVHVGRTSRNRDGLLGRLRAHMRGQSSFVVKYLKKQRARLRRGFAYSWVVIPDDRLRTFAEALGTGMLCPLHVGTGARARR